MKELTKEDKARRYDEVINRMKHYVVDEYGCSRIKVADVFPELSESEDEKIRKALMSILKSDFEKDTTIFGISVGQILAWLEKQSERKSTDKIQIGKEYKCIASPRYSTFMTGKIYKPENKFLCRFMNFCSDCFEPIEDSEQIDLTSNTDKVESKFKVGDWVVTSYGDVSQVISVDKDYDGYTLDNDNYFSGTWCDMYHLWTIDDAKDGDVLVDCNKDESILMFRGIGNTEWDNVIDYHCYYSCFRKAFCVQKGVEHWGDTNDHKLKPAAKEQCDLLFQKMREAGYEWDNEKKQLIKLNHFVDNNDMVEPKFKIGDKIIEKDFDECDCGTIIDIKDGKYIFGDGNFIWIKEQGLWELVEKTEPKFKDGDWIVYRDNIWKVCNIGLQMSYELLKINNEVSTRLIKEVDENAHLWTINDAKPGDIIYAESKFNTFDFIEIFYTLENRNFWGYCDVSSDSDIYSDDLECWEFDRAKGFVTLDRYNFYPATKEQRHLLYQKMKDAGYEWDAEKKELKDL